MSKYMRAKLVQTKFKNKVIKIYK